MSLSTKASDWEVFGICQIGGAVVVGGGVWFFEFRSQQAAVKKMLNFSAFGIGLGGSIGGVSLPKFPSGRIPYSTIQSNQNFSLHDLDCSMGRITMAGVSVVVGYSFLYISAFNLSGHLFASQPCHGLVGGVGASGIFTAGVWSLMK